MVTFSYITPYCSTSYSDTHLHNAPSTVGPIAPPACTLAGTRTVRWPPWGLGLGLGRGQAADGRYIIYMYMIYMYMISYIMLSYGY